MQFLTDSWHALVEHITLALANNVFTTQDGRMYFPYIVAYLCVGALLFGVRSKGKLSLRGMFKAVLPRSIVTHPSTAMDLKIWVAETFLTRSFALYTAVAGAFLTAGAVESVWVSVLGEPIVKAEVTWVSGTVYALLIFMVADFTEFLWHYATHKIGFLWELHKVHHSAEVLTPLTEGRFHPIDLVAQYICPTIAVAIVSGSFMYFYDGSIIGWTVSSVTVYAVVMSVLGHFYHSHVWLSYGRVLNHVFISPAQHQIHHSVLPEHRDKNLANMFAFWDYLFGTLYVPKGKETFPVGLGEGVSNPHTTLLKVYIDPVRNFVKRLGHAVQGRDHGDRTSLMDRQRGSGTG